MTEPGGSGQGRSDMRLTSPLALLLIFAFLLRLAAYAVFGGIVHADEIFQYTEQAHRLVFGQGLVPWEYRLGIRSWLFPGMLAGVMAAARLISAGPVVQNAAVALFMALVSLPTVACAFLWAQRAGGAAAGWAAGMLVAAWPDALLVSVHPLIDSAGADALIPGLFMLEQAARTGAALRAGSLLGLALALRPQLLPVVAVAGLRFSRGKSWRLGARTAAAMAAPVLAAGLLDWLTLGGPFASLIRYVAINRAGAANYYGIEAWYHYLLVLPFSAGWLFFALVPLVWIGAKRLAWPGIYAGVILLSFSLIAHKEFRFVLAAFPLLLTVAGVGAAMLLAFARGKPVGQRGGMALGVVCAAVSLVNAPFTGGAKLWLRGTGMVAAEHRVSADPTACAVAVVPPTLWYVTGGYTHLRPGIRITGFDPRAGANASGFDYAVTGQETDLTAFGLMRVACWRNMLASEIMPQVCLWHHAVPCAPAPELRLPAPPFLQAKPLNR